MWTLFSWGYPGCKAYQEFFQLILPMSLRGATVAEKRRRIDMIDKLMC